MMPLYTLGRSMPPGMASGRVLQDAWNLLWFSILRFLRARAGTRSALAWPRGPDLLDRRSDPV
jgi:hypothetical protein